MNGCFGGCLGRVVALVFLAIIVIAAWRFGPGLVKEVGFGPQGIEEVSPEVGALAMDRYSELAGATADSASFSGPELESILRFHALTVLPPGVTDPTVDIRDGELRIGVRVSLALLPSIPELERIRHLLPDSVPVEFRGSVVPLEGARSALIIRRIDVAAIPIPRRFHGPVAAALDPARPEGLPEESITFALPDGIQSAEIHGDELVVRSSGASAMVFRPRSYAVGKGPWPES